MTRKIALLLAAILLSVTALARPLPDRYSPFQYGHRWYFSFQAGPAYSPAEYQDSYFANGKGFDALSWHGALAFGYNFNDAWDLRISGVYGYNAGALSPYNGFYPHRYHAAELFADVILNYNALAEYNTAFNVKTYAGIGGAYTFGFTEVNHPYQVLDSPNLCPGIRVGGILEYDYKSGFGLFFDLGAEAFTDWYNGHESDGFPVEFVFKLSFGLIYHFPLRNNR